MIRFLGVLLFAVSLTAATPSNFASFTSVDDCGGQSAFLSSTNIIEQSFGFCNQSALSITSIMYNSGSSTFTVTLPTTTNPLQGLQTGDQVFFAPYTAASCITRLSGYTATVSGPAGTNTFTIPACTMTAPSPTGLSLYANYANRSELKVVTQNSGTWSATPTYTLLSTSSARTSLSLASNCSFGNPTGYFDGSDYYIAFIVQNSSTCGNGASTGAGTQYNLWACYLGASPTTNLTSSDCGKIIIVSTPGGYGPNGGVLDPHIWHTNKHIYVSERDNHAVYTALSTGFDIWSVDDVNMSWGTGSSMPTGTVTPYVFNQSWNLPSTRNRASPNNCEQFYKLTGLYDMPGGSTTVRAFFQANDINSGGVSPFTGYATGNTCDSLGAGISTDSFDFAGLFYADLTGTCGTVCAGANYNQFYPNKNVTSTSTSCLTPTTVMPMTGKWAACYGEFPWMFYNGTRMIFVGNATTPASIITQCGVTSGCQTNYTSELITAQVATDFSTSAATMTLTAAAPYSNKQNTGSSNCQVLLSQDGLASDCGLFPMSGSSLFGGCGHLDVDEATQYVTCANSTSFKYTPPVAPMGSSYAFLTSRTMVFSYSKSMLNPAVQAFGPVQISGGPVNLTTGIGTTGGAAAMAQ